MVATPLEDDGFDRLKAKWFDRLNWSCGVLSLFTEEQQLRLAETVQFTRHRLGEILWSTEAVGEQCLLVSGKAILFVAKGNPIEKRHWLPPNACFGDLLPLPEHGQVKAASSEVVVARWKSRDWSSQEHLSRLRGFLEEERRRYQLYDAAQAQPVSEFPFVFCVNAGVASLVMLAQWLGISLRLKQVEALLRGQRPEDVIEAAEKLGFRGQLIPQADPTIFARIAYPVMIGWHQHWAVAFAFRNNRLCVSDPRNLRRTCESLALEEVEKHWNGRLLQLELQPQAKQFNLSWFLPAVWRYRKELAEVLLASLTLHLLGLGTPMLSQIIIDKAIVHGNLPTLNVMAVALCCIVMFQAVLGILRMFIFSHTTKRLELSLTAQLFNHLLKLPLAYFEQRRVGDTIARVSELDGVREFLTGTALTVVIDAVFSVIYVIWMLVYSPKLTGIAFSVLPLLFISVVFITPLIRNWLNEAWNLKADSQSYLVEVVSSIAAIKARASEFSTRQRFERLFARYVNQNFRVSTLANINHHFGEMLLNASELLLLFFGAKLVIEQQLTVGQLVAFQMVSGMALHPLLRLAGLVDDFQQVSLSVDRLADILNSTPELDAEAGVMLAPKGNITFETVSFSYATEPEHETDMNITAANGSQIQALKDVSFSVQAGQFVGIVGGSGSGKSTLTKLLLQLYRPNAGRILIDGVDIRNANLRSLRQQMSVVLQDDAVFRGSILENIAFNAEASREQIQRAAELALVDEFAEDLRVEVGERGTGLSGGQRQRVALSRLFLSNAPILILDEGTSALDAHTERSILAHLKQVSRERTVVMVTHRLAAVKDADMILVMSDGTLVEQGSHRELIERRGTYWSLWRRQHESE